MGMFDPLTPEEEEKKRKAGENVIVIPRAMLGIDDARVPGEGEIKRARAQQQNPDAIAEAMRKAEQSGRSVEHEKHLQQTGASASEEEDEQLRVTLGGAPITASMFEVNEFAQVAHDDVGVLGFIENTASGVLDSAAGIFGNTALGVNKTVRAPRQTMDWLFMHLGSFEMVDAGYGRKVMQWMPTKRKPSEAQQALAGQEEKADQWVYDTFIKPNFGYEPKFDIQSVYNDPLTNTIPFIVETGVVSLPEMAAAMLLPEFYVVGKSHQIGSERAENMGREPEEATLADMVNALPYAAAVAVMDRFGGRSILGIGDDALRGIGAKEVTKSVARATGREAITEGGQEYLEYAGAVVGTGSEFDWIQARDRVLGGMIAGGGMGFGVRTVTASVQNYAASKRVNATLQQINESMKESKLRERLPDVAGDHLARVMEESGVTSVFVNARELQKVLASLDNSAEMALRLGVTEEAIHEAMDLHGDIEIDVAKFGASVMGTDLFDALKDHTKLHGEAMTPAEAKEFEETGFKEAMDEAGAYLVELQERYDAAVAKEAIEPVELKEFKPSYYEGEAFPLSQYDPRYGTVREEELTDDEGKVLGKREVFEPNEGLDLKVPAEPEEDVVFRGVSAAEFEAIVSSGVIQSLGSFNIGEAQEGLTYYTTDPSMAESYANSFAPSEGVPDFGKPAYIIAVRRSAGKKERKVEGTGSKEVGIEGAISADEIVAVYRGIVIARNPGVNKKNLKEKPSATVAWERINMRSRDLKEGGIVHAPLAGLPETSPGPMQNILEAARRYAVARGISYRRQGQHVRVDPERGARIAAAYDAMEHAPNDPLVQAAYSALIEETLAQYQVIKRLGINIEMIPEGAPDPYPEGPKQVLEDLRKGHLWVFRTDEGFGSREGFDASDHPLLAETNEKIGDYTLKANDVFRIVHDVFGHGKEGVGFGPSGEENAWQSHVRMYTPLAAMAMTTETRGQNSWVNFGPYGESNRANQRKTVYADQKAGLLPAWVMNEGLSVDEASMGSGEGVELAAQEMGFKGMFNSAQEAGWTEGQQVKYLEAIEAALQEADTRLEKRELLREQRRNSQEWKKEEKRVKADILEKLRETPVYKAINEIASGRVKLDRQMVEVLLMRIGPSRVAEQMVDPQTGKYYDAKGNVINITADLLPKDERGRTVYTAPGKEGIDPDVMAEAYGYPSGIDMLLDMLTVEDFQTAVYLETDRVMRVKHKDLLDERAQIREALRALESSKTLAVLHMELDQMRAASKAKKLRYSLVKKAARRLMATRNIRNITSEKFRVQANKFGRASGRAWRKGNREEAASLKLQQILNLHMAMEADKAQGEANKMRLFLRSFVRRGADKQHRNLPVEDRHSIREILGRFQLTERLSEGKIEKLNEKFNDTWNKTGAEPVKLHPFVEQQLQAVNWQDLTLEEFRLVYEAVKEINAKGLRRNKFRDEKKKVSVQEEVDEITKLVNENLNALSRPRKLEKIRKGVRSFTNMILNMDSILREIDGFKDLGKAYEAIKGKYDRAWNEGYLAGHRGVAARQKEVAQGIVKLYDVFTDKEKAEMGKVRHIPGLDRPITGREYLSILLNMGNEQNISVLMDGNGFSQEELQAIRDYASERDLDWAQSVWDFIHEFFPEIKEAHARRSNRDVKEVEALGFEKYGKTYRGGYFPIRHDRSEAATWDRKGVDATMDQLRYGGYTLSHTSDGHTLDRSEASGTPLLLDPFVLNSHMDQVVYDLEMGDAVIDIYKVVKHPEFKKAFMNKNQVQKYEAIELWLENQITGEMHFGGWLEGTARWLRSGYTVSKLGWNLGVSMMQPLGLLQSGVDLGHKNVAMAALKVLGSMSTKGFDIYREVAEDHGGMAQRDQNYQQDITLAQNQLNKTWLGKKIPLTDQTVADSFFLTIKLMQRFVDTAVYIAAKKNGLVLFDGDEVKAKRYAFNKVTRTQASGIFGDRSLVEQGTASKRIRNSEVIRAFTMFSSYFFAKNNVAWEQFKKTNYKSPVQIAQLMANMTLMYTVEAVIASAIVGRLPDEDEGESWAWFLFLSTVGTAAAGVPFVREASSELSGFRGGGMFSSVLKELGDVKTQVAQGEPDEAALRQINDLFGIMFKYPSGQMNKTAAAASRLLQDDPETHWWHLFVGPDFSNRRKKKPKASSLL